MRNIRHLAASALAVLLLLVAYFGARQLTKPAQQRVTRNVDGNSDESLHEMPAKKLVDNRPPSSRLLLPKVASTSRHALVTTPAASGPTWVARGPFPIPNGATQGRQDPVSGRVTAIAVHPTNPSVAYVGTAQGGVYRTLDGGNTWSPMMDNAAAGNIGTPLAIGAVAIDPTNPSNVLVGTGEGNLAQDSYFGCGLYIITRADSADPVVNGPYTQRQNDGADVFTGRSIVSIAIDPANHNNIFCATSSGVGGIVPSTYSVLPPRGLYRSTNAFAGIEAGSTSPRFVRLDIEPSEINSIVTSVVIDPANANNLVCSIYSQNQSRTGGIYQTSNALADTPTFTRSFTLDDDTNVKLAINRAGNVLTVYAATEEGTPNGRLYRSDDGGVTFGPPLTAANGFAGGQGFYDIAIAVDPTTPERLLLGGNVGDGVFLSSSDGGKTFTSSTNGLHVDVHAIAIAPSNPAVVYHGNDGGIWKSVDSGFAWQSLNNATFSATQFVGLAVHPNDANFSIGGTQDNGTEFLQSSGNILRADGGDGGYSLIDRNAKDIAAVTMYHTYFNETNTIIGTARVLSSGCATDGGWSFHGSYQGNVDTTPVCDGSTDTFNGISLSDPVNFYPPQVLGPGNPNTWYFGTNKLYRSVDRADTAAVVSQDLDSGTPISAIAISVQDDNLRLVGLNSGKVFATSTGSSTLVQIAGPGATNGTTGTPASPVGRIAIDPINRNVAYLCFGGFGSSSSPIAHVWKTTNLTDAVVSFTPASNGLPDIPVNAIVIDAQAITGNEATSLYVGTDAGVYYSFDAGASWNLYGNGLPHSAVWALEIQPTARILRAATHGRGLYDAPLASINPTPTPTPGGDTSTKLTNVSTRGMVEGGDSVMIAGVIVSGPDSKQIILRGIGPSLGNYGISFPLFDPNLTLYDAQGNQLAFNDNYGSNSSGDLALLSVNQLTPRDPSESALVTTLNPGAYTVIMRGKINGVGLVEAFDISSGSFSAFTNISTRGKVEQNDEGVMIAGFIISQPSDQAGSPVRVAIRALGPSLKQFGVVGALADPTMEVYHGFERILVNDSWTTNSAADQQELRNNNLAPSNTKEAALVTTLDPGSYTVIIRGKSNTTGVALAEVYRISP